MELCINVDSLQKIVKKEINEEKRITSSNISEKYKSKLVKYNFFIQNEIEISGILNKTDSTFINKGIFRFLLPQKYDFVKLCESNKKTLEKLNIQIDLTDNDDKYILLKYNKDVYIMNPFIDVFFNTNLINNTSIFPENSVASSIFWDIIINYETFFDILIYLSEKEVIMLDFSSKNLYYNKPNMCVYLNNFEKCIINGKLHVKTIMTREQNNYQNLLQYQEIEKHVNKFVKIIESMEYYGNKHFDLYFSKQLIKTKNFNIVFQNLDKIIDDYLDNLYFLTFFSDNFKNDYKTKWKKKIKATIKNNIEILHIPCSNISWKLYLVFLLDNYSQTTWETFSLNSLFLNIIYSMLKIFAIKDKSSIVHRFFKFLFKNMDINCTAFCLEDVDFEKDEDIIENRNTSKNISIFDCMNGYNEFRKSIEINRDYNCVERFFCLQHVSYENQIELYNFLIKNVEMF